MQQINSGKQTSARIRLSLRGQGFESELLNSLTTYNDICIAFTLIPTGSYPGTQCCSGLILVVRPKTTSGWSKQRALLGVIGFELLHYWADHIIFSSSCLVPSYSETHSYSKDKMHHKKVLGEERVPNGKGRGQLAWIKEEWIVSMWCKYVCPRVYDVALNCCLLVHKC
jgi:hypothetical protein